MRYSIWARLRSLRHRLPHPKPPRPKLLLFLVDWCVRASVYERRVVAGVALSALVYGAAMLYVLFITTIAAYQGPAQWIFANLFAAIFLLGLAVPPFIIIAWGGLWLRRIDLYVQAYDDGMRIAYAEERWVNPDEQGKKPFDRPGFLRRFGGKLALFVVHDPEEGIVTYPYYRDRLLYSTIAVGRAVNHEADLDLLRTHKGIKVPFKAGAIALIIICSLFFAYALATDPRSFTG